MSLLIAPLGFSFAGEIEAGKLAYQQNCMACHLVDTKIVGPSLIDVAATYPKEKVSEFIAWAKNPGKKDPRLLQMPPMAHVPEETLTAIHAFILEETKGKTKSKSRQKFPSFKEPERELPYVVRAFLPNASPASVAVVLKDNLTVCWDTEACRFRYAWSGSKTRLRQGHTVVKLEKKPFYRESSDQLWSFAGYETPQFRGYRLREDGSPEFVYIVGGVGVHEHIFNGVKKGSFIRQFKLSKELDELKLDLAYGTESIVVVDKGSLDSGTLTLTGTETKSFTLTIFRP